MHKRLYDIGITAYVALLILAILLYKERTIITDTAYVLFDLVKDSTFSIQISRIGAVFTQTFPLLAVKMGLSLKAVMTAYSISFIAYYFLCYLACGLLRRYDYGLIILFLNFLFVSDSFYWIISELPQAIAFLTVGLAWANNRGFRFTNTASVAVAIGCIILLNFFHPLIVIPLAYALLFFYLTDKTLITKRIAISIGALFLGAVLVKTLLSATQYDRHSFSGIKNFITRFPNYFNIYSNKQFLLNCVHKYYWIPVMFIGITVWYAKQKEYKKLLLVAAAVSGHLMLVNVSYPDPITPGFYIENLYAPTSFFLALPFVVDVLPNSAIAKYAGPLIIFILVSGIFRMYNTRETYTNRLNWERNFLREHANEKIIANAKKHHADVLQILWGTPYEFWLLSTTETGKTASILIDDNPGERLWAWKLNNAFLVNWNIIPYSQLPVKYFRLTDSTTGYTIEK